MQMLIEALEARGISVTPFEHTFNLVRGEGPTAHRVNVELPEVVAEEIHAFVAGVEAVMSEPGRSNARGWDYRKTAARVSPNLVTQAFLRGANLASGGDPVFEVAFADGLALVVFVQLDRGTRLITVGQVQDWGATSDRVVAAARSLLYHHTGRPTWEPVEGPVFRLSGRDEYQAVRAIVFEDLFFGDTSPRFRFGMPAQDAFYFTKTDDPEAVEILKGVIHRHHAAAQMPLSKEVFAFDGPAVVPVQH